jgi:hypothetical protein
MANSWRVQLGNLWGGFRVGSNKALPLVNPGEFKISDKGTVELSARYDPPGSGWRALIVAIVTGILVTILAQATGFCAGPGWLLWYILIILVRRKPATLTLAQAESVVVDAGNRRLGFLIDFQGARHWVAFEIPGEQFHEALKSLKATTPAQINEGQIKRRLKGSTIAIIVMVGLMVVLMIFAIVFPLMYAGRQRPRINVAPAGNSKLDQRSLDGSCDPGYFKLGQTDDTNT